MTDYINETSEITGVPKNVVDRIIRDQWRKTVHAMVETDARSVEVTSMFKFEIGDKRVEKRMEKLQIRMNAFKDRSEDVKKKVSDTIALEYETILKKIKSDK